MKQGNQDLVRAAIRVHIAAEGPVTFGSILHFTKDQVARSTQDYEVTEELNALLQHGIVRLYEDGITFI